MRVKPQKLPGKDELDLESGPREKKGGSGKRFKEK